MISARYDSEHHMLVIEFAGHVDAAQAEAFYPKLEALIPACEKGFTLLTDLSAVDEMDLDMRSSVRKSMDLLNRRGVREILRVIPDPAKDIGFNIMSLFHYSSDVTTLTFPSRADAQAHVEREARNA